MGSLMTLAKAVNTPQVMRVGGPVPNPLIGSGEPEDIWVGPDTRETNDTGLVRTPPANSGSNMRVINPETLTNLGFPNPNSKNNVDTLRRKRRDI